MLYTQEEKNKIYDSLDKIKAYIETLQPQIRDRITVDFGEVERYADFSREKKFHLYVSKTSISGRSGGLGLDYTREEVSSSTRSTVYRWLDYATALIQNWQFIKREILNQITEQNATISAINNFEI